MTRSGLYVHLPFCITRCPYCAFHSGEDRALIPDLIRALRMEARSAPDGFGPFETLYLGGGTPSVLSDEQLAELVAGLRAELDLADLVEVTLEANPADVSADRAARWLRLGLHRISLGVQSLSDRDLAFLGRRHDVRRAREAVRDVRQGGIRNLSLDLIYGLPGQGPAELEELLGAALSLEPEHLSCYQLTVESGTPLASSVERGEIRLPGEEESAELFLTIHRLLTDRGWDHYEVSSYARSTDLRSRHNGKYWTLAPYLGLGPAAHSLLGTRRWWNEPDLERYLKAQERGKAPVAGSEERCAVDLRRERVMLGLRTSDGVSLEELRGGDPTHLVQEGLLEIRAGRAVPTAQGMLVADGLARELS